MPDPRPLLPARYFGRLLQLLDEAGVPTSPLVDGLGIDRERLEHPDTRLGVAAVDQLIDRLVAATGRLDWGFELGLQLRLTSHALLGYGLLASPTLGYALNLIARYFPLTTPTFRMRVQREARCAVALWQPALPLGHAALVFHADAIAAAVHNALAELLRPRMPAIELALSWPLPHAERYERLAQARCRFGVDGFTGLRLRLPAELLDQPLTLSDAGSLKLAEARLDAMVRGAVDDGEVAGWVRMMLREARNGPPSLDELAHTLNLSPRTLERHLKAEGCGFRQLAAEAVAERARTLLAQGHSVTAVALELGYTDASNFARAFRRTTGLRPGEIGRAPFRAG